LSKSHLILVTKKLQLYRIVRAPHFASCWLV